MAKVFPEFPSDATVALVNQKRKLYVYRDGKWDLAPLVDQFDGDDDPGPIVSTPIPNLIDDDGDTVIGAGRVIKNTFTIKDLEDLETI